MQSSRRTPVTSKADVETLDAAGIAEAVRAFYDRHPYPPPVADLDAYQQQWNDDARRRADAHLFLPSEPYREDRCVLVAGCGTVQAVKYALRWPHARVVGIDVSSTSLQEADALRRRHRLDNLELHRLPVERVTRLGRSFEHVVCTGVLHHLPDPDAGLRALRGVLHPRGAMHIMLYAPYGRTGIYLLQEYCRRLGLGSQAHDVADLAAALHALPADHPLVPLLRAAPDFREPAGLADALLHPQDRPYTVQQMLALLGRHGLRLARWVRQAPYLPQCGVLADFPHHRRLAALPLEEQYAAVELFRGTMTTHSAVVHSADRSGDSAIEFTGDAWQGYVPVRVPGTISVTQRLPHGAAAVLINPAHTYTDLYLAIDEQEAALVEAIDGVRTLGEVARAHGDGERVRNLFQRLWWYDQVVFDTSGGPSFGASRPGAPFIPS